MEFWSAAGRRFNGYWMIIRCRAFRWSVEGKGHCAKRIRQRAGRDAGGPREKKGAWPFFDLPSAPGGWNGCAGWFVRGLPEGRPSLPGRASISECDSCRAVEQLAAGPRDDERAAEKSIRRQRLCALRGA